MCVRAWMNIVTNWTWCLWSCSQTSRISSFLSSSMCGSIEPEVSTRKTHVRSATVPNTRRLPVWHSRSTATTKSSQIKSGAKVWNGLPSDVTSASSLSVFKNRLKTYLFGRCYETVWLWMTFPFPSHYLTSRTVVLAIVFHCLGHCKNVYDDDDDEVKSRSRLWWMKMTSTALIAKLKTQHDEDKLWN